MNRYRLIGAGGSPYSMKMRAILRYRRLPHDWILRTPEIREQLVGKTKVELVPVLHIPWEDKYLIDSTPLAYDLEARHPGERSIIPDDPAHAFFCALIEDMADEWVTKQMFHLRWEREEDQQFSSFWIIADSGGDIDDDGFAERQQSILNRQVGRMALVGCTPENAPIIHASYRRLLGMLESHVRHGRYLFGSRPSLADFALFGQLVTLSRDLTPSRIMKEYAPHTFFWVRNLDDSSGVEGEWADSTAGVPKIIHNLLSYAADEYLPFLAANVDSLANSKAEIRVEIGGKPYVQAPFAYQAKCLASLKKQLAELPAAVLARVKPVLEESGCWYYLQ